MTATRQLADLTSPQVAALDKSTAIAIQPVGAIEQHGRQLPVRTDALIAETIGRRGAERYAGNAWVLPTLSYGKSTEHLGYAGTITLSATTLLAVLMDVGRSVAASGFRKLVLLNGHGGQPGIIETAARDIRVETGLEVFYLMPPSLGIPEGITAPDMWGLHASQIETSIVMALAPELVDLAAATPGAEETAEYLRGFDILAIEGAVSTAWLTRDVSPDGAYGDPRGAFAEQGHAIVEHWTRRFAETLGEIERFRFPLAARS